MTTINNPKVSVGTETAIWFIVFVVASHTYLHFLWYNGVQEMKLIQQSLWPSYYCFHSHNGHHDTLIIVIAQFRQAWTADDLLLVYRVEWFHVFVGRDTKKVVIHWVKLLSDADKSFLFSLLWQWNTSVFFFLFVQIWHYHCSADGWCGIRYDRERVWYCST